MIFADTAFFIALLSPADEWHEAAVRHSRQARERRDKEWSLTDCISFEFPQLKEPLIDTNQH